MDATLGTTKTNSAELRRARQYGDLVWADKYLFAYQYNGKIYVMEPPDDLFEQVCDILEDHPLYNEAPRVEISEDRTTTALEDSIHDALVGGAGVLKFEYIEPEDFNACVFGECQPETEEAPVSFDYDPAVVMQLTSELAWSLKEIRNILSRELINRPFTMQEHEALHEATDLLDRYRVEFDDDMDQPSLQING
jgi:hypothetical protein